MKRNLIYALLIALSFGFISCDNSLNNYKRSRAKIDKLLAERQFEKAREVANNVGAEEVKAELLNNISYTQLNMMMEDGDYETASSLARELQQDDLFYDAFFKNIRQIVQRGNYDFIFETFMGWQCSHTPQMVVDDYPQYYNDGRHTNEREIRSAGNECSPGEYNYLIRPINAAVDVVMQKVMYEGNATNIRHCLACYKPYCLYTNKNEKIGKDLNKYTNDYMHRYYFEMQNTAKEDAEKMLREAKIEY